MELRNLHRVFCTQGYKHHPATTITTNATTVVPVQIFNGWVHKMRYTVQDANTLPGGMRNIYTAVQISVFRSSFFRK